MQDRTGTAGEDRADDSAASPPVERLLAIDWLRGIVMVLMALDHVDHVGNPRHASGDSAWWSGQLPLSAPDFLTRWASHLCAPTFLLLCGVGIALSRSRSIARGEPARGFDRHLIARGAVLLVLEGTLMSFYWRAGGDLDAAWPPLPIFLQVLWALGAGMILMVPLRRLSLRAQVFVAVALLLVVEVVHGAHFSPGAEPSVLLKMFVTGGNVPGTAMVLYPALAWLPLMLFGHVLGWLFAHRRVTARMLLQLAFWAFVLFLALRWLDGFGNQQLHRRSDDWLEWLHCSKYPPSITFFAMELGIAFALLAALTAAERALERLPKWNPIEALGQTALFFYVVHIPMIGALMGLGVLPAPRHGSAAHSWLGAVWVALACWPLCVGYGWYKRCWRHAWTRFL